MLKKTLLISTLTLSLNAFSAGYTGPAKITAISSITNNIFEIYGTWNNVDGCSKTEKWIVGMHAVDTAQSVESKYAMAMSAYLSDKTVEFYVDGCNQWHQPIIKGVFMPARFPQ